MIVGTNWRLTEEHTHSRLTSGCFPAQKPHARAIAQTRGCEDVFARFARMRALRRRGKAAANGETGRRCGGGRGGYDGKR